MHLKYSIVRTVSRGSTLSSVKRADRDTFSNRDENGEIESNFVCCSRLCIQLIRKIRVRCVLIKFRFTWLVLWLIKDASEKLNCLTHWYCRFREVLGLRSRSKWDWEIWGSVYNGQRILGYLLSLPTPISFVTRPHCGNCYTVCLTYIRRLLQNVVLIYILLPTDLDFLMVAEYS